MKLASAADLEGVGGVGFLNAHADIGFNLLEKAVAQVARGHKLALLTGKGAVVDNEVH